MFDENGGKEQLVCVYECVSLGECVCSRSSHYQSVMFGPRSLYDGNERTARSRQNKTDRVGEEYKVLLPM